VHPLVGEWVTDVPLELFTISQSVAANPVSIFFLITANNVGASQFPHFTVNTNPVKD
jgi:hypothetical protein